MRALKRLTLLHIILWNILFAGSLQAAHIIGGVITYECTGTGKYRFTMKIYRDCNGGGAAFDSGPGAPFPGTVTVFRGNAEFRRLNLSPPVITNIQPNLSNPCLIAPPNVCVEEGIYKFDLDLPVSTESYHIVYQRCCRNNTITNIVAPGETGATYWIELTPDGQKACNNSPVFKNFPPIVICAGEPIDFDHAAIDKDGDSLTYELCAPFRGGGINQQNPTEPNGVAPDPDLPPPYSTVTFISPTYSFMNPLAGNPPLAIDPHSGFMTGKATITGQFVVGVCVKEWRDGKVLSIVRRDFQFNVAKCDPTVVADIKEDSLVMQQGKQFFVVNACGPLGVFFKNQSFQAQYIFSHRWEFDIEGTTKTFTPWDAQVDFPAVGVYFGKLLLNPGTGCDDTAYIKVNVFPDLEADFSFAYDTCLAGPVAFTDLSRSDAGPGAIKSWEWKFGDGALSNEQNPKHTYQEPGEIPASITVVDINGCKETIVKMVRYFPVPEFFIVAPSEFIGCQPAVITFNNLSYPVNESYSVVWNFGDGTTGTGISPTHVYSDVGTFTVSVEIISPLGCKTDTVYPKLITVLPSPFADFTYSPPQPSNLQPTVAFTDKSIDAVKWKWTFDSEGFSIEQNPVYTFPDTGMQRVQLVVFHASGCPDTAIQFIDVIPEVRYHLPNAFTPNGDGTNDGFRGVGMLEGASSFSMTIWNRYGEKVFETTDPFLAWNGRKNNTGEPAPQGVYVVVVNFRGPRGEPNELRGFATLIR